MTEHLRSSEGSCAVLDPQRIKGMSPPHPSPLHDRTTVPESSFHSGLSRIEWKREREGSARLQKFAWTHFHTVFRGLLDEVREHLLPDSFGRDLLVEQDEIGWIADDSTSIRTYV